MWLFGFLDLHIGIFEMAQHLTKISSSFTVFGRASFLCLFSAATKSSQSLQSVCWGLGVGSHESTLSQNPFAFLLGRRPPVQAHLRLQNIPFDALQFSSPIKSVRNGLLKLILWNVYNWLPSGIALVCLCKQVSPLCLLCAVHLPPFLSSYLHVMSLNWQYFP